MKFLPIVMLLLGAGAGIGAGYLVGATPPPKDDPAGNEAPMSEADNTTEDSTDMAKVDTAAPAEYVAFNNQFVVPVVRGDMVTSLVVLSLGVEVDVGHTEMIYTSEPKLRDTFLQVLFDHANMGGFRGRFTDGNTMDVLRMSLTEAAQSVIGPSIRGVMITDIARQDL